MGIKDLLRFMKPYTEPIHIKKYAGKRVGIDAYSWLHKGAYSCSMEICLDSDGDKKLRYIDYFMHRINLLRFYKITPVVVFDGGSIPCKAATEQERRMRREASREMAVAKLKEGNVNAAIELFQKAVSITPYMAHQLIQNLKTENIEFVVAPYEADAQLAYLSSLEAEKGGIAAVITEDSDLLAYGCQATMFKMDRYGNAEEIELDAVFNAVDRKPSFQRFDKELFIAMCVLAGCDFLPSIPGIGIFRAHSFVSKYKNLERVLSVLKLEKRSQMPENYCTSFREALAVFQHARVYDATTKTLKHIAPLPQDLLESSDGKLDFLGPEIPNSVATAIAEGKLNPVNMEAFNSLQGLNYYPLHIDIEKACEVRKTGVSEPSRQKNSFTSFLSQTSTEEDLKGIAVEQDTHLTKKYIGEALGLRKLITPTETHISSEELVISAKDSTSLKVPTNPFSIRKCQAMQLSQTEVGAKQGSLFMNVSSITQDSTCIAIPADISLSRKRNINEISDTNVVAEVEHSESEVVVVTQESQESVNSEPRTIGNSRGKTIIEKSKRSKCKSSDNKNATILNFFSRG